MGKARSVTTILITVLISTPSIQAQDVVLPGSTVQGDILRGEVQFLKGMAWYELNAANARELDVKTAHELDQWNREVYGAYQRELSGSAARRRSVRNANQFWVLHRDRQAFRIAARQNTLIIAAPDKPDADGPIVQLFPRGGDEELWHVVSVNQ